VKFLAGIFLGMLLSGPTVVHNHYDVTETFWMRLELPETESYLPEPLPDATWQAVDGEEACVIELLGGYGAEWGAAEVMNVLDEAWADFNGPCDMLASR